jgi:lipoyl-dependent peroxiredoxin
MFKRTSTANWKGSGLEGSGTLSMQSGVFKDQPYSFKTRFQSEDGKAGTNPEELLAASHAGCFAMALSFILTDAGHPPEELDVSAIVTMKSEGVHWSVAGIELKLQAKVPGIDAAKFQELAGQAKSGCPISKALSAVSISLDAKLV